MANNVVITDSGVVVFGSALAAPRSSTYLKATGAEFMFFSLAGRVRLRPMSCGSRLWLLHTEWR